MHPRAHLCFRLVPQKTELGGGGLVGGLGVIGMCPCREKGYLTPSFLHILFPAAEVNTFLP